MSEATLSNLILTAITAFVTIALAAITAWKTAKLGAHSGAQEAMEPVQAQLIANAKTLATNTTKLDEVHSQTGNALENYKESIKQEAVNALSEVLAAQAAMVATAIQDGIAKGIEQERQRQEKIGEWIKKGQEEKKG